MFSERRALQKARIIHVAPQMQLHSAAKKNHTSTPNYSWHTLNSELKWIVICSFVNDHGI